MEEFENLNDKSINQNLNDKNINHTGGTPEYSFWAEQTSAGTTQPTYTSYIDYNEAAGSQSQKSLKKKHRVLKFIAKALCFGILAGASFIGIQFAYQKIYPEASANNYVFGSPGRNKNGGYSGLKIESTQKGNVATASNDLVTKVADSAMPSIVSIHSISTDTDTWFGTPKESSGSGIIVEQNEEELLIATNNHVVSGTDKITVTFIDGSEENAIIKGTDAMADLAVITVDISDMEKDTLRAIKVAKLGDSGKAKVGEMAIAIGNALGYGQSVTVGFISAKDRTVEVTDGYSYKTMVLLQTDAAINPGNSGGALLNVNGEVIGINTVKFSSTTVEGMGYAIPITRAVPIINELMSREILAENEQGYLGVYPADVTEEVSKLFNMPIGVFLSEVEAGGPADKAGLLQGDIITFINDVEITSSTQLRDMISSIRAGTEVEVTFMRGSERSYREQKLTVVLGARPAASR